MCTSRSSIVFPILHLRQDPCSIRPHLLVGPGLFPSHNNAVFIGRPFRPIIMPSSSSASSSSSRSKPKTPWQDALEKACRECNVGKPDFQIVSDRRGGRTAWSSSVTVSGQPILARFWYDGNNLNNAKEDAAEVAYNWLTGYTPGSPSTTRNQW